MVALKQGYSVIEIICITIIKRHDYRVVWNVSIPMCLGQLLEPYGLAVFSQYFKMLAEVVWRHTQRLWA